MQRLKRGRPPAEAPKVDTLLTLDEVAEHLRCTTKGVRKLVATGCGSLLINCTSQIQAVRRQRFSQPPLCGGSRLTRPILTTFQDFELTRRTDENHHYTTKPGRTSLGS